MNTRSFKPSLHYFDLLTLMGLVTWLITVNPEHIPDNVVPFVF
jgi:hypothetical protein